MSRLLNAMSTTWQEWQVIELRLILECWQCVIREIHEVRDYVFNHELAGLTCGSEVKKCASSRLCLLLKSAASWHYCECVSRSFHSTFLLSRFTVWVNTQTCVWSHTVRYCKVWEKHRNLAKLVQRVELHLKTKSEMFGSVIELSAVLLDIFLRNVIPSIWWFCFKQFQFIFKMI